MTRRRSNLILLGLFLFLFVFGTRVIGFYTDWLWFTEIGFEPVYLKVLYTKIILGFGVGGLAIGILYANFATAIWLTRDRDIFIERWRGGQSEFTHLDISIGRLKKLAGWLAGFIGLLIGLGAATEWQMVLMYFSRVPVGESDPLFGRDVSYYFFELPFKEYWLGIGYFLLGVCFIGAAVLYALKGAIGFRRESWIRPAKIHLSAIAALYFLCLAINTSLDKLNLVYSPRGVVAGASYTDIHADLPLLNVLFVVALLGVGLLIYNCFTLTNRAFIAAIALYVLIVAVKWIYPALLQRFVVQPNEVAKETPFILNNIAATRKAYGVEGVEERALSGESTLTVDDIKANAATINNVRLWDRDPLLDTFSQIQEIRTYYEFENIDVDRYMINGEYRQTMLSPRELSAASLPSRSWLNEHLVFTHGYGVTLGPVNRVTPAGLPVLFIKDLPPVSDVNIQIQRPEIYFGEYNYGYAFVRTKQQEFNYPAGEDNVYSEYDGKAGVRVNSAFRRFMFALRFGSMDILLSNDITNESQVLFYRNIKERMERVAPFLRYDSDPYMVISGDGRLIWICDAYTVTDRYPYATSFSTGLNYIRNSVKVVLDAYHGQLQFFVTDPTDPLIQVYRQMFPVLFVPLDQMSADLRAHLRYPSDLFRIQSRIYATYHMTNPQVFYNKEDQWEVPTYTGEGQEIEMEPYHTIMKLPDESKEEFLLIRPFTPRKKDNLSAWMVARMDGEHYGKLISYEFPKQKLLYGPRQVTARVNQDPEISRQLSLWDQRGSQAILGRQIVIPIEESLIYVQPLYLRAANGKIPELKRVIVAYQDQIAMEESLEQSLFKIFGAATPPASTADTTSPSAPASTPSTPATLESLVIKAKEHYDRAQEAIRAGDWNKYGDEIKQLGEVIRQMQK